MTDSRVGFWFIIFLLFAFNLRAQETTAALSGALRNEAGERLPAVLITVKHLPTGAEFEVFSNSIGEFVLPNLKAGGPYSLSVYFAGYQPEEIQDIYLSLGENSSLDLVLKTDHSTAMREVQVVGNRKKIEGVSVGLKQLNTLPALGRSLSDFTRSVPQSNNNSFAGTNFRYNNITMDGAVNNDAIGFSNSFGGRSGMGQAGTAGAGTRTNPYSLETIQEVQVQLAPYDVKLGNFTGGSVNAVTKSGSNIFHGSVYGYGRNQYLVGRSLDASRSRLGSDFYDYQTGASLSGPIFKNKLFFFLNAEFTGLQEPSFYNAGDPGAALDVRTAQSLVEHLMKNYQYNPEGYGPYPIQTKSDKLFARIDWHLSKKHTLMLRGLYTHGQGQNLQRSATNFQFSSTDFTQNTKNLNLVGELKSSFGNNLYNTLILSYINVREYRDFPGRLSPFVDIGGGEIWLGAWREAAIYNVKQKTFEITNNLTWIKENHKFTFGTHNEFYNIDYNFINSWNGRWEYASVEDFFNDKPSRIRGIYAYDPAKNNYEKLRDDMPGARFNVNLLSLYLQDEIALGSRLKITPGIRLDYSFVSKQPDLDKDLKNTPDFHAAAGEATFSHTPFKDFSNRWLGQLMFSPRLGFEWDAAGSRQLVFRGGSGIFNGRMPFAWLGYAYTLSGNHFGAIDYRPRGQKVDLVMDPSRLREAIEKSGGKAVSATREVNIVDNNFKLPSVWRSNLAVDIRLGDGYKLTFDAMYTKTLYDVKFQQINLEDRVEYPPSGPTKTPVYMGKKLNPAYSNIYLLTNTSKGYSYNLTTQLSKEAKKISWGNRLLDLYLMGAYTYGVSKDISNGIRNSFQSNYETNPAIIPNTPELSYSNFDLRHRIVFVSNAELNWNLHHKTSLALFYAANSGSPYSFIYNSSPNAFNNGSKASLAYIPRDRADINLKNMVDRGGQVVYSADEQWRDLNAVIEGDPYLRTRAGAYAERNAARTPWNQSLDIRLMHEFKFNVGPKKQNALQLSLDIFNVLNLINKNWGRQTFVTNVNNYTVNLLRATTDAHGIAPGKPGYTPTYYFDKPPDGKHYYSTDPIGSRWQAQLGVKYIF